MLLMKGRVKVPCKFDHNGECLICDCWSTDCAYDRWLKQDFKWETKEQLDELFSKWVDHERRD
jgi:hypothetical protein